MCRYAWFAREPWFARERRHAFDTVGGGPCDAWLKVGEAVQRGIDAVRDIAQSVEALNGDGDQFYLRVTGDGSAKVLGGVHAQAADAIGDSAGGLSPVPLPDLAGNPLGNPLGETGGAAPPVLQSGGLPDLSVPDKPAVLPAVAPAVPVASEVQIQSLADLARRDSRRVTGTQARWAGGEGGIRTHGPLTVNGFQDRRIRPLCHLSGRPQHNRRHLNQAFPIPPYGNEE